MLVLCLEAQVCAVKAWLGTLTALEHGDKSGPGYGSLTAQKVAHGTSVHYGIY